MSQICFIVSQSSVSIFLLSLPVISISLTWFCSPVVLSDKPVSQASMPLRFTHSLPDCLLRTDLLLLTCLSLTNLYGRIMLNGSAICPWLCSASVLPGFRMPDPVTDRHSALLIPLCVFSFCQSSLSATTVPSTAQLCQRSTDSNCKQEAELYNYTPICLGCYCPFY